MAAQVCEKAYKKNLYELQYSCFLFKKNPYRHVHHQQDTLHITHSPYQDIYFITHSYDPF